MEKCEIYVPVYHFHGIILKRSEKNISTYTIVKAILCKFELDNWAKVCELMLFYISDTALAKLVYNILASSFNKLSQNWSWVIHRIFHRFYTTLASKRLTIWREGISTCSLWLCIKTAENSHYCIHVPSDVRVTYTDSEASSWNRTSVNFIRSLHGTSTHRDAFGPSFQNSVVASHSTGAGLQLRTCHMEHATWNAASKPQRGSLASCSATPDEGSGNFMKKFKCYRAKNPRGRLWATSGSQLSLLWVFEGVNQKMKSCGHSNTFSFFHLWKGQIKNQIYFAAKTLKSIQFFHNMHF